MVHIGTVNHREGILPTCRCARQRTAFSTFSCVGFRSALAIHRVTRHAINRDANQKIMLPEEGRPVVADRDAVSLKVLTMVCRHNKALLKFNGFTIKRMPINGFPTLPRKMTSSISCAICCLMKSSRSLPHFVMHFFDPIELFFLQIKTVLSQVLPPIRLV